MINIHVLASGSTGNAVLFHLGDNLILIDAGISARRIERSMAELGYKAGNLDAILLTHEHKDHITGLEVLVRRHKIPVYTRPKTWRALNCRDKIPTNCVNEIVTEFEIGGVGVQAFAVSHDAVDPVGYSLYYKGKKIVLATDLGTITEGVEKALAMSDALVLESNHDPDMLARGPYPHFLKQRIKSHYGHLSNHQAALLLSRIPRPAVLQVLLAHLSQQNNTPLLARETVGDILANKGCPVGEEILLYSTHPGMTSTVRVI